MMPGIDPKTAVLTGAAIKVTDIAIETGKGIVKNYVDKKTQDVKDRVKAENAKCDEYSQRKNLKEAVKTQQTKNHGSDTSEDEGDCSKVKKYEHSKERQRKVENLVQAAQKVVDEGSKSLKLLAERTEAAKVLADKERAEKAAQEANKGWFGWSWSW